ncbi:hypothetical protein BC937DRAFT_93714 [Endogone sp. FLAS-F59071]|nr:hypothetical protein BC937DRAFT_93714 [Endogone sp. FLAS-F59071]|eukprot:RUS21078.1 hypothetical protein BC937DRAFT_93714 [Endogone sp. FLAS-F59071]
MVTSPAAILQIPNVNYPPSFEPTGLILLGHCRYTLRAYIDTLGMPNWHTSKPVNIKFRPVVVAPVNCSFAYHNRLQQQPKKAAEPVEVDVQLTMPKEVWFAGESISLEVHLINMSNTTITSLRYCMEQRIDVVFSVEKEYKATHIKELAPNESFQDLRLGFQSKWTHTLSVRIPPDADVPTFHGTYHIFSFQIAFKIGHTRSRFDKESFIDWAFHIPLANISNEDARQYVHLFSYRNPPTAPQIRRGGSDDIQVGSNLPTYQANSDSSPSMEPVLWQPQSQVQIDPRPHAVDEISESHPEPLSSSPQTSQPFDFSSPAFTFVSPHRPASIFALPSPSAGMFPIPQPNSIPTPQRLPTYDTLDESAPPSASLTRESTIVLAARNVTLSRASTARERPISIGRRLTISSSIREAHSGLSPTSSVSEDSDRD